MNIDSSCSDEHLIGLAQQGHSEACNVLLRRYNEKVKQVIQFYVNDPTHAHDLAQEVLLKVYRYIKYFNEESQFSTWLYRIVQNTLKNHYRAVSLRLDSEAQYAEEYHGSTLSHSPEYLLINIELGEQISNAVSRLTDDLRICYGMHIFEGHTYEDIAKHIQCPIGTVRSRIFRARKLMIDYVGR